MQGEKRSRGPGSWTASWVNLGSRCKEQERCWGPGSKLSQPRKQTQGERELPRPRQRNGKLNQLSHRLGTHNIPTTTSTTEHQWICCLSVYVGSLSATPADSTRHEYSKVPTRHEYSKFQQGMNTQSSNKVWILEVPTRYEYSKFQQGMNTQSSNKAWIRV